MMGAAHGAEFLRLRFAQEINPDLAGLAAPQPPRRTLIAPHQLEIPFAFDQIAHAQINAEPAAIFAGAPEAGRSSRLSTRARHLSSMPSIRPLTHAPRQDRTGPESPSSDRRP